MREKVSLPSSFLITSLFVVKHEYRLSSLSSRACIFCMFHGGLSTMTLLGIRPLLMSKLAVDAFI